MASHATDYQNPVPIISPHCSCMSVNLGPALVGGRTLTSQNRNDPNDNLGHLGTTRTTTNTDQRSVYGRKDLEFLQLNLHHCKSASLNLRRHFDVGCIDIALIQEPWVYRNKVKGLDSKLGTTFVGTRSVRPRVCMFVSNNIHAVLIQEFSDQDLVAVRIRYMRNQTEHSLICCSVYFPYDSPNLPPSEKLRGLVTYSEANDIPIVIGCDANSHHAAWGSTDTNSRGAALLEYIVGSDLELLNRGNEPTFVTQNRAEVIDISLSSASIWQEIVDWRVSTEVSLSDHRIIRFRLLADPRVPKEYRNPLSTDWAHYKRVLVSRLDGGECDILTTDDIEDNVKRLQDGIILAYEASCPIRTVKPGQKTPYWSSDLAKLRKRARRAWNHRVSDPEAYKTAVSDYGKALRRDKRASWRQFCGEVDGIKPAARLHKILSKDESYQIGNLRLPSGIMTESDQAVADHLLETHFPGCESVSEDSSSEEPFISSTMDDWLEASKIVSEEKIRWAIEGFGSFKSAGEDGVFPALLKNAIEILCRPLEKIFTACVALGYIPKAWRNVRVVFIPKPGRASYELAKSFRPISLTSFFLKTLERLIDLYIRTGPLKGYPLHEAQHAYQRAKSCETALHDLVSRVELALNHKIFALGAFLDVEGAFDNTSFDAIKMACDEHYVHSTPSRWIDSMLKHRIVRAEVRGVSSTMIVRKGCPQGGVLSPLLWNMVIDGLIRRLNDAHLWAQGFADDVAIVIIGKFLSTVCDLMQNAMDIVQNWCNEVGLSVNADKTTTVLFTRNRRLVGYTEPTLFGRAIGLKDQVKYLGVILDNKLTWNSHIDHRLRKATIALWQCRRAIGRTWGLRPKVIYWIYTSVIRPILTYAAVLWWKRAQRASVIRKIGHLQRLACICITGSMRSTPTSALEVLLLLPPLNIFIEREARQTIYRLKCSGRLGYATIGHSEIIEEMIDEFPFLLARTDKIIPTDVFDRKFSVEFPARNDWYDQEMLIMPPGGIVIYTDGSFCDGRAGAGVYSETLNIKESYALGAHATVFQTEVYAILACSGICRNVGLQDETIIICSDSRAALLALSSYRISSSLVSQCWSSLQELSTYNRVKLLWVPGHSDIRGNEMADEMARRGSGSYFCGPEPCLPLSTTLVQQRTKDWAERVHYRQWTASTNCRQSKQWIVRPNRAMTRYLLSLTRNQLRILVSMITGHSRLKGHLHKMGLTQSPDCDACGMEEETTFHFLCVCPSLSTLRTRTFGRPILNVLGFAEMPATAVLRFATSSGRFARDL
jgi:ribonuclease HI